MQPSCFLVKFFFKTEYGEIKKWFIKNDQNLEIDNSGFTSYKFGIGVYISDKNECYYPDSVIVFIKEYYS